MKMAAGKSEFTSEERRLLKALAGRLKAQERSVELRSGESVVTSLRVDKGLLEALKERAERDGQTTGEAMNRALEGYLESDSA